MGGESPEHVPAEAERLLTSSALRAASTGLDGRWAGFQGLWGPPLLDSVGLLLPGLLSTGLPGAGWAFK